MTSTSCFWLAVFGMLLLGLASLGAKLIYEIAWHELKEFCIKRDRRAVFDEIHDDHDDVALGLETLRAISIVLLVVAVAGWFAASSGDNPVSVGRLVQVGFVLLAGVLVGVVWLPNAVAREFGVDIIYHLWRVFRIASYAMLPFSVGASALQTAMRRMGDQQHEPSEEEAFEDEILAIVTEGMHDGHLEADAREMIEGVIELGDADVADIMTPRSKMDTVSIDSGWDEVLKFVRTCGRTRIPVCGRSQDEIEGILYVKDLLSELSQHDGQPSKKLRELLRVPWYVPPTQKLDDLLQDFLQTRNHLAIVRDEFKRVAGIVTIEDVLEEIVGEIVDETDKEQLEEIHRVDDRTAIIQGRAHLADINEQLGLELPEPEDFDTIAGYVVNYLGRIPKSGEQITVAEDEVSITVLHANKRKVERVRLQSTNGKLRLPESA